jgi:hypothetical protein
MEHPNMQQLGPLVTCAASGGPPGLFHFELINPQSSRLQPSREAQSAACLLDLSIPGLIKKPNHFLFL